MWVYRLFHSCVSLLFIPLPCESTVYSTPMWALLCESTVYSTLLWVYCLCHYPLWLVWLYCLFHSSVSPLFIRLTVSAVYSIILCGQCDSSVYSTPLWACLFYSSVSLLSIPLLCRSTVYSTPLWVYCLFHSYVSLLFIPLLCESTVYSSAGLLFIPLI